jgi:hypothetical protein
MPENWYLGYFDIAEYDGELCFSNYFKVCRRHFVLGVASLVVSKRVACFHNTTGRVNGNLFCVLSMLSHECTVWIILLVFV